AILIIGVPFFVAFIGFTRVLALVEGRLIEGLTGERMPRRATPAAPGGWLARIGAMLRAPRTWTTLVYQLLMLPLGTLYFSVAITLAALGIVLLGGSIAGLLQGLGFEVVDGWQTSVDGTPLTGLEALGVALASLVIGVLLLTAMLHLARFVGRIHARIAKQLLVAD
ncbi:MAG: sensor domain-containing protein, partial [Gammaproteobacteria bacterium]